jgi:predicted AAA+ superfamily ATPase
MPTILPTLLEEFNDKIQEAKKSIPRQASFSDVENLIKVATSMRRVGKTYTIFQKILGLLDKKVPLESIRYLNFEDNRLLPMDYKNMGKLIDDFYTLFPENHSRECHIFLDEVQNIPDWAVLVRRFFDSKKVPLYLTGSSAKLLSKEIATALRGRAIEIEIWPYSFAEFMSAHSIVKPKKPFGKKTLNELRKPLLSYLDTGGFPAVQFLLPAERQQVLQGYVETVSFRDIIERHKISNISLLRYTTKRLMKNIAGPFSINKFHNDITSQG